MICRKKGKKEKEPFLSKVLFRCVFSTRWLDIYCYVLLFVLSARNAGSLPSLRSFPYFDPKAQYWTAQPFYCSSLIKSARADTIMLSLAPQAPFRRRPKQPALGPYYLPMHSRPFTICCFKVNINMCLEAVVFNSIFM